MFVATISVYHREELNRSYDVLAVSSSSLTLRNFCDKDIQTMGLTVEGERWKTAGLTGFYKRATDGEYTYSYLIHDVDEV